MITENRAAINALRKSGIVPAEIMKRLHLSRGTVQYVLYRSMYHRGTKQTPQERFEKYYVKGEPNECWIWQGCRKKNNGYGMFTYDTTSSWSRNGRRKQANMHAHVASYLIYVGPLPNLGKRKGGKTAVDVMHTCDNPGCVNPNHLIAGTHQKNMHDAAVKGRMGSPRFTMRKLTGAQAKAIRDEYIKGKKGHGMTVLGRKYGLSFSSIQHLLAGKTYKDAIQS